MGYVGVITKSSSKPHHVLFSGTLDSDSPSSLGELFCKKKSTNKKQVNYKTNQIALQQTESNKLKKCILKKT